MYESSSDTAHCGKLVTHAASLPGFLLLLQSLRAQSMSIVMPEVQANRGTQIRGKGRDQEICRDIQGFAGLK